MVKNPVSLQRHRGFTLIEMIIVLVIIGIIAAVAVPRFAGTFDTIRFKRMMSEIILFLRDARIKAMSNSKENMVVFDLTKGLCWDTNKNILRLPEGIEMFTDRSGVRDTALKTFLFYPNGTALEGKLGFAYKNMSCVLHVEPLGGLVYFTMQEDMEQLIHYPRSQEILSDEEIKKYIDKTGIFGTLKNVSGLHGKDAGNPYPDDG